ncbi:MAG: hypothetical protein ACRDP7_41805 [Trebonia sp.]
MGKMLAGLGGVALVLSACGPVPGRASGGRPGQPAGCVTTVRGVARGPGSLAAGWLPAGFHLSSGSQPGAALPMLTYTLASTRPDPPRLELGVSVDRGPLSPLDGGRQAATPVTVQGHRGLLEGGPPAPQFQGVYWKPGGTYLLSVVGYKLPGPAVLKAARHVSFTPPGAAALPVAAGPVITRQQAVAAARRAAGLARSRAAAKLSSWTEITALLQADHPGQRTVSAPDPLTGPPWRPVWAVLLTPAGAAAGSAPQPALVIIGAASGRPELTARPGAHPAWFAALTDRDPAGQDRCPGGSSARLPFGVLTRDEQSYLTAAPAAAGTGNAIISVMLKLATVPAVNKADPGLYGGCAEQDCSLGQLVWVTIETVRARPGTTVACLPASASYPAGYHPKQVTQYYAISVPGNAGIGCGPLPGPLKTLEDLAPPAS